MSSDETYFVECAEDGSLTRTSAGTSEWLEERHRKALRREVRELAANDVVRKECRIDGAVIRIVRLIGESEDRYLAAIDQSADPTDDGIRNQLTERQFEVAEHAATGATAKEIAEALDISRNTVKHHLKNIYDRLGIGSRVELADHMP